jgi:4-hydroxy-tetrahydrodipicolinate synthase
MKAAMAAIGILPNGRVRPPTHAPTAEESAAINAAINAAGLSQRAAA